MCIRDSFGNIDAEGKLEADVLDEESKRQLCGLGRMGFMSILENVIREERDQNRDPGGGTDSEDDNGAKSPTAEDYSDITEMAEDEGGPYVDDSALMPPPPTPTSRKESPSDSKKKLETPLAAMVRDLLINNSKVWHSFISSRLFSNHSYHQSTPTQTCDSCFRTLGQTR